MKGGREGERERERERGLSGGSTSFRYKGQQRQAGLK